MFKPQSGTTWQGGNTNKQMQIEKPKERGKHEGKERGKAKEKQRRQISKERPRR